MRETLIVIYLPNEPFDLIQGPPLALDILVEFHLFSDMDIWIIGLATQDTIRCSRNPCFQSGGSSHELLPSVHDKPFCYS